MTSTTENAAACPVTGARAVPGPARGPLAWPMVGSTVLFATDPPGFTLKAQRAHGTVVRLPLVPNNPTVQITDVQGIRRVLQTNPDNYRRGVYYRAFELFMGQGLLTLPDDEWREHRQVVNPAFTPGAVSAAAADLDAAVAALLDRWSGHARAGRDFDLLPDSMAVTAHVLGRLLVGADLSRDGGEFAEAITVALEATFKNVGSLEKLVPRFVPLPYHRRVRRAKATLDRVVQRAAEQAAAGEIPGTVAALLHESQLPPDAFAADLVTLFLAGVETTGLALTWALYEVARHPAVRRRLEAELAGELGGRTPTLADLANLEYTRMVVDETLRMHPSVWQFPREAVEDDVVAGHHLPAGTPVFVSVYGAHHNPRQWADPEAFDPERFRPGAEGAPKERGAYLPFGAGRRQCIGKKLGLAVLQLTVAAAVQRFRLSLAGDRDVAYGAFITLFPQDGIRVRAVERVA